MNSCDQLLDKCCTMSYTDKHEQTTGQPKDRTTQLTANAQAKAVTRSADETATATQREQGNRTANRGRSQAPKAHEVNPIRSTGQRLDPPACT